MGDIMKISEIYVSFLGEGQYSGYPAVIVRLAGCNLRCKWCDTPYSLEVNKNGILTYTPKEVFDKIVMFEGVNFVLFTGGEPLLQRDELVFLAGMLQYETNKTLILETSGSVALDNEVLSCFDCTDMDIKCPSSKMEERNIFQNIPLLGERDELKFVMEDFNDFKFAKKIVRKFKPKCNIVFSMVWGNETGKLWYDYLNFARRHPRLKIRVQTQLHKVYFGNERGV